MDFQKLNKYVFSGGLIALFSDGTAENISDYIKIMRMEINMEQYVMPILFVKFNMKPDLIIRIQQDDAVLFNLNIISLPEDTESTILYNEFIKSTNYKPIRMDRTPINYSDKLTTEDNGNYQYEPYECILVPDNCLKENKKVLSGVLNNASITDALVYLASQFNCNSVIEKPDNDKQYDQIVFIPGNLFMNLRYLEDVYGIYNKGSKYFFYYDKLLISSNEKFFSNSYGKVKMTVRFPSNTEDSTAYDIGTYTEGNDRIINTIRDNVQFSDYSESFKEIYGNNQKYYSRDLTNYKERMNSYSIIDNLNKPFNKTKVFYNRYNNEQKENEFFDRTKDHTIIQFYFDNIDITIEDCFKVFHIDFDNEYYKSYNGLYYVLDMGYHFVSKQSSYDMKGLLMLKRI